MNTSKNLSTAQDYFEEGEKLQKIGKTEEAVYCYQQAIKLDSIFFRSYFELGNTFRSQGKIKEAVKQYIKTIEICPEFPGTYHKFVWLDFDDDLLDELIQCCQKILENKSSNKLPLKIINTTLGDLLSRQKKNEEAIIYYQNAVYYQIKALKPDLRTNIQDLNYRKTKPSFFIIGAMKSGTTSLYDYLSQHPKILPALKKEIHFFNRYYHRGINWYLSHFSSLAQENFFVTGEATPCLDNSGVAQKLSHCFPKIKIIILLRNPVDRAYSHYYHMNKWFGFQKEGLGIKGTFLNAIKADIDNQELSDLMLKDDSAYQKIKSSYISKSLYLYWLKEWLKFFSREQLLILKSETFYSDPQSSVNKVLEFLQLPSYSISSLSNSMKNQYEIPEKSHYHLLQEYFKPHNQKLEEFLDLKFHWN